MTIEERFQALERTYDERLKKLELELEKEKAITQIQNCMGRYVYMHTGRMHKSCVECFAVGDPDLSIEIGPSGVYKGPDAADRVYTIGHNASEPIPNGFLAEHPLTTAVIEVADDLQTAKALWITPGHEAAWDKSGEHFECDWMWGRYACDFKFINGQWKIWHMQMFSTFRCDYYTSWGDTIADDLIHEKIQKSDGTEIYAPILAETMPDHPTTFFEEFSKDRPIKYWPQPPQPYRTFAGSQSMVGAPPEGVVIMNDGKGND